MCSLSSHEDVCWGLHLRMKESLFLVLSVIDHWRSGRRSVYTHTHRVKLSGCLLLRTCCRWAKWTLVKACTGRHLFGELSSRICWWWCFPVLKAFPKIFSACKKECQASRLLAQIGWMLSQGNAIIPNHLSCKLSVEIQKVTEWWSQRAWGEKLGYMGSIQLFHLGSHYLYCHVVIKCHQCTLKFHILVDSLVCFDCRIHIGRLQFQHIFRVLKSNRCIGLKDHRIMGMSTEVCRTWLITKMLADLIKLFLIAPFAWALPESHSCSFFPSWILSFWIMNF